MPERSHIDFRDRDGAEARIAYRRTGQGPALVLIHGVGLQGAVWAPQIEALAVDHDVIAVDMLGHGGSSLPPADTRLVHYADAILALLDALGIDRAHIAGHSMGALVALECALDHPGRVRSVIAMNAVFRRTPEQRAAVEARVGSLGESDGRPDWSPTLARWFGSPVPGWLREAAESTRDLLQAIDPIGYARTYGLFARSDADHEERLSGLTVPALFITGEHDPNSTPAMSQAMGRISPHGEVQIVPDARHMMILTDPATINRRLRAFIGKAGQAPAMAGEPWDGTPIDPKALRKVLGAFLTGVTVIATLQEDGSPRGFTANSFTSVSLDPPLVLVCIAKTASSCPVFTGASHFSINILAEHQASVSSLFASKAADKFAEAAWRRGPAGSPILDGVAAWLDCRRHEVIEAGDHIILLGQVVGFDERPANPLGYCRGAHVTFGLPLDALAGSGGRTRLGAILEHERSIVLVEDGHGGLDIPRGAPRGGLSERDDLAGRLQRLGLDAELGFLFAIYDDPARGVGAMSVVYRGTLRALPDPSPAMTVASLDGMPWDRIRDEALAAMLRRYIDERREDMFGIYVGDAERGTVQPLARSA